MDDSTLGARIKRLRGNTMTQRELADAAGVSLSLVRALEQEQRHTASVGSLHRLARALDTDTGVLLGKTTTMPGNPAAGVMAIRRALTPVDDLLDEVVHDGQPVELGEAQRLVDYGWGLYWSGRYEKLSGLLPTALAQLRATAHAAPADDKVRAQELLARGYWLAACSLVHLGQQESAWLAIRQALDAAKHGQDELLDATLRGSVSWQLLVQGRYDEAAGVALRAAVAVEPSGLVSPQRLSVHGTLLLSAATASGRDGMVTAARDLLAEARSVADRNGVDRNDYESPFGVSQVVMQTVDVAVVTEDYAAAIEAARSMPHDAGLPLAARARHLTDTAYAHAHLGHVQQARDALLTAEAMAPAWIKYQTLPRQVAAELVRRDGNSTLRGLARRLGVTTA
ncbi:MAG TPA: helix-turn-helix transcriptional regulator [Umezawaea sp.]|nr:helix-turn-helix transcriptional regulator [Umezawaea sp.]